MSTPSMQDKRFRQMLDAAPDAMIVVDQQGSAVALNREAERLLGWTDAEAASSPWKSTAALSVPARRGYSW